MSLAWGREVLDQSPDPRGKRLSRRSNGVTAVTAALAAGSPGKRFALPHARILIHQPYTEGGGQGSDIEIQANEILRMREEMVGMFAQHTGRTPEQVSQDIERDKILTADMAVEYGIIDRVIASRKA